ncbi:MAG: MoaD/ThiS family protein [Anaerolineae bacterium]|jgi:molybdopterin converting factor small subunit
MKTENNVNLRIPTPLRPYAGKQANVALDGATVEEAVGNLFDQYPALRRHIVDDEGALRNFVNLYLNGDHIDELGGMATPLSPGDRLAIIPAIAGG